METPKFLSQLRPIERSRHHLPHWDQSETCVFVTFRLADSLPADKLAEWEDDRRLWLAAHPQPWTDAEVIEYGKLFGARLDKWLDSGFGSCVLADPENNAIVWNAILHFDGVRYDVYSFVVMSNHVHLLIRPHKGYALSDILRSLKSYTSKLINRRLGRSGTLWQHENWDRLVRDMRHFAHVVGYIARNPGESRVPVYLKEEFRDLLRV